MTVKRIVPNVETTDPASAEAFYGELLGLRSVMDQGWIRTYAADGLSAPQISFAAEGGSGTAVPDLSVEVDDVDAIHRRAIDLGFKIEYGPCREPWGVRRFFVRDPFGRLVNILAHEALPRSLSFEPPRSP